ncbi:polymorphic membrane protein [Gimesia panareensis]|uniref:Polymorphic membrane protein n=1 Tax=Gimesia panareensis TaxID=2527978 RepID=A0A517QFD7_9PLAN|nr:hypothetical protein [Gimesia panareensis]QDT30331.1 polymorphic membrane protein [Gimesia panareensis]
METLEERTLLTAFTVMNTDNTGAGSLRAAIEAANANEGADTITFDASLAGQTIVLGDELSISDDLTITGLGADQLTIDGNGDSRIFFIKDASYLTYITVELENLTLTNGKSDDGGAILSYEKLILKDSVLTGNSAKNGGGIYQYNGNLDDATLTVLHSEFIGNEASSYGGGIFAEGVWSLDISSTTFDTNKALSGGAIYNKSGPMTIQESSFSGNQARGSFKTQNYVNSLV